MAYDLEERLLAYSVKIIKIVEKLPDNKAMNHIASQLLKSGTSPYPNHGEAQAAESKRDFIHKNSIVLKELRETQVNLKMMKGIILEADSGKLDQLEDECNQLVSIFYRLVQTAKRNDVAK